MNNDGVLTHDEKTRTHRWRTLIAAVVCAALVLLGMTVPAAAHAADASSDGVTLSIDYGDQQYDGTTVVVPGTAYKATLAYDMNKVVPGTSVTVAFPAVVSLSGAVPAGNTVVDSVTMNDDGTMTVKFKDDPDPSIQQGFLEFGFTFDAPDNGSTAEDVTWKLNDVSDSQTVIVKNPGDEFNPGITDTLAKTVGAADLNSHVHYDADSGAVTVDDGVTAIAIPYTITVSSDAARTATVTDTLSDYLAYDQGSFTAELTTWDENGLNKTTTAFPLPTGQPTFDGQGFTLDGLALPAQSQLAIHYTAKVKADEVSALQEALQAKADPIDPANGGGFSVGLTNKAAVDGGTPVTGTTTIGGSVPKEPQPNIGAAFSKQSSLTGQTPIELKADGTTLVTPLDVTYRLNADLTQFDLAGHNLKDKYALTSDVVITDTLPDGVDWSDGDFLTATVNGTDTPLTQAPAGSSATDLTVGQYLVSGKTLTVNVGKDTGQKWQITASATITTLAGIDPNRTVQNPSNQPQVATIYTTTNVAFFDYKGTPGNTGDDARTPVDNQLIVMKPDGSQVDDPAAFDKVLGQVPALVNGQSAQIPYTFTIAKGAVLDLANSEIVDHIDHDVFDVTAGTLAGIRASITGSYGGQGGLTGADFDLVVNSNGDLLITPSAAFGASRPGGQPQAPLGDALVLSLNLPTQVVQGKQTLDISNSATVQGATKNDYDWTSETTGSATSYGDELEVRKAVYNDGSWTQNLRVPIDQESGLPVQSEFIYRVQLLPHGNFAGHAILDITDVLPAGTTLLGFVSDDQLASGTTSPGTSVDLAGNLTATLDASTGKVVVSQKPGTTLTPGSTPYVNFKVKIDSFTDPDTFVADLGVTNRIGASQATVTPSDGYPLQVLKTDALRPNVAITDRSARFTITGPDGHVVTDEAYVVNGQLMVKGADGKDHGIVIPAGPGGSVPAGDYTVTETKAPAGYDLSSMSVVAKIADDGSSSPVTMADDPTPLYAIGDYTWIDSNRDGVQDDGESVLPGVKVDLLDAVTGDVVATTTTDADGHYLFDLLPAGDYRVRFTLTDQQAATYTFTRPTQGGDVAKDSDADQATGESGVIHLNSDDTQLVAGSTYPDAEVKAINGIDPTWDAGVVRKSYAIGDYTWIDSNRDGVQDPDEPVLPGVTVTLTDQDGNPVKDVNGNVVAATTTDADGHYLFDDLPAGSYRVTFILTDEQSKQYVFTTTGGGSPTDSDAVVSSGDRATGTTSTITLGDDNAHLTEDYDTATVHATEGIDPTWDAGVVARSYAIGDVVWIDSNRDGLQGGDEPALSGVTVTLTDADGNPVQDVNGKQVGPVTTDKNGHYLFDDLPAGSYKVTFTLTDEQSKVYRFTKQDAQSNDPNADSDADTTTGSTGTIVLGPDNPSLTTDYADAEVHATDGIDPTWDAGVIGKTYAVGDYTWIDSNRDGVQDGDEPVLPGVTVELLNSDGAVIATTTTDDKGHYQFDELPAGDYQLHFILTGEQAAKYTFTAIDSRDDDAADSDAVRGTGYTVPFRLDDSSPLVSVADYQSGTVTATEGIDPRWDAGVVEKTYAVGDYVWIDSNRDGEQGTNEPVLPGVTVDLIDPATGDAIATTTTDDEGRYLFDGLPAGDYRVRFTLTDEQAKKYVFTSENTAGKASDSDADRSGLSAAFHLGDDDANLTLGYDRDLTATEGVDPTWDAGVMLASVQVGDRVWVDKNGNGRQDKGDPGIPGVVLVLTGPDGKPVTDVYGKSVGPVTTDKNGNYLFPGLPALEDGQHYTVSIDRTASKDALKGYLPTTQGQGDRQGDSSTWTASSDGLTQDGEQDLTLDFGFVVADPPAVVPGAGDDLAKTGSTLPIGAAGAALLLLIAGAALILRRRRTA